MEDKEIHLSLLMQMQTFLNVDTTTATTEVITDAQQNNQLKRCKFPRSVCEKVNCIIAVQYSQLQYVLILPSGVHYGVPFLNFPLLSILVSVNCGVSIIFLLLRRR